MESTLTAELERLRADLTATEGKLKTASEKGFANVEEQRKKAAEYAHWRNLRCVWWCVDLF